MPLERGRVALVPGSSSVATDDLYPLLRRRLLILTSIIASAFVLGFGVDIVLRIVSPPPPELAERRTWHGRTHPLAASAAIGAGLAPD
jgi:hypothetical protein